MRKRGYSGGFAAGIIAAGGTLGILLPPSITMILFAVAAEQSLGRLFLAGIGPGFLLVALFATYAVIRYRQEYARAKAAYETSGQNSAILARDEYTMSERFSVLPRVLPFVTLRWDQYSPTDSTGRSQLHQQIGPHLAPPELVLPLQPLQI